MFGLIVFGLLGIYLLLLVAATVWGYRHAAKKGLPRKQRWLWAAGVFLLVYLPVFWDWLPTVVSHRYYCEREAGFWVYKTLDQWKAENPGVIDGLVDNSPNEYLNWPSENWNGQKIANINQRFGMLYRDHLSSADESEIFLNVWRWKSELVDKSTGEVLARQVDFSAGNDGFIGGMHSMKFWLESGGCIGGREHSMRFGEFLKQFRGAKK